MPRHLLPHFYIRSMRMWCDNASIEIEGEQLIKIYDDSLFVGYMLLLLLLLRLRLLKLNFSLPFACSLFYVFVIIYKF